MEECGNKIKQSCDGSMYAICVKSELTPPSYSNLTQCFSTEEVDIDQYSILTNIKNEIDLLLVTSTCGILPTVKNTKTLIQYLIDRDCAQQLQIDALITQNTIQATQILNLQSNPCP
jgi:hypothetical protein